MLTHSSCDEVRRIFTHMNNSCSHVNDAIQHISESANKFDEIPLMTIMNTQYQLNTLVWLRLTIKFASFGDETFGVSSPQRKCFATNCLSVHNVSTSPHHHPLAHQSIYHTWHNTQIQIEKHNCEMNKEQFNPEIISVSFYCSYKYNQTL